MPIVVSRKRRIFFTVEGERGPNLLLLHGLLGTQRDWYDWGFVAALSPEYRLILPDLLGHGRSEGPPQAPEYALTGLADDMTEVLNNLEVRNATVAGCSLGALVGFNLALRYPERVRGAFLGGESPYPTEPFLEICREAANSLSAGSLEEVLRGGREAGWAQTPPREVLPEGREQARRVTTAIGGWEPDESKKFAPRPSVVLFCGLADPAYQRLQKARNITARARLVSLPDMGTLAALAAPALLLSELTAFVQSVRSPREDPSRRDGTDRDQATGGQETPSVTENDGEGTPAGGAETAETPPDVGQGHSGGVEERRGDAPAEHALAESPPASAPASAPANGVESQAEPGAAEPGGTKPPRQNRPEDGVESDPGDVMAEHPGEAAEPANGAPSQREEPEG